MTLVVDLDHIFDDIVYPMNTALALLHIVYPDHYSYSNLNGNTETDYNNITWSDGRTKPSWTTVVAYNADAWNLANDLAKQRFAYEAQQAIPVLQSQMAGTQAAISAGANIVDVATNATTNAAASSVTILGISVPTGASYSALVTAYNDLATKHNDLAVKFNTLLAHLEAQGLQTP